MEQIINYVETIAIPALNEEKKMGRIHSAVGMSWGMDAVKVAKAIEERTNFKCTACGGTVYVKMI
jgi:hypothetical protein